MGTPRAEEHRFAGSDRPFLRRDTFYAEIEDGIQFSSTGPAFRLSGTAVFAVFERLVPFLNGDVRRDELRAAVGPSRWNFVESMLSFLAEREILRWIPQDDVDALSVDDRGLYTEQIAFLAQYSDRPHAAFVAFRDTPVHIVGGGEIGTTTARNLAENGHRAVRLIVPDPDSASMDQTRDLLEAEHVIVLPTASGMAWFAANLTDLRPERCLLIVPGDERIFVLPHQWSPGAVAPDWMDAVVALEAGSTIQSLQSTFIASQSSLDPLQGRSGSTAVQRMLGAILSYEVFKGLSGVLPAETATGLLSLDAVTGEATAHPVFPRTQQRRVTLSPAAPRAEASGAITPEDSRAGSYPEWCRLVDEITMPVTRFDDDEVTQLPLKVTVAIQHNGVRRAASSLWTTADARIGAIERACEDLVAELEPSEVLLPMVHITTGESHNVHAERVFRRSRANSAGRYERSSAAVAVALRAGEATAKAVRKAVEEWLLLENVQAPSGVAFHLEPTGRASEFVRTIDSASKPLAFVHLGTCDVDGATAISVVVAMTTGDSESTWQVSSGPDPESAAVLAAVEVLALRQLDTLDPAITESMRTWSGIDPRALIGRCAFPAHGVVDVVAAAIDAPFLSAAGLCAATAVVLEGGVKTC
ncbi:hypothetical protein [Curtobacterium sp. PhB78]|uniref:hypothetical protein n=1 Tax=Curtobacterium sp. PhB78 TaxID=2485102 RepID=UPI000FADA400|nr:hypothetical protein [Curtobacterium sp. PhB78]ROS45982.1 hypothetical protein EDF53_0796 [Curtobacterium sp. PhB78]